MPMSLENPSAHTTEEKLVRMANQIARQFDAQAGDTVAEVVTHLTKFWENDMLVDLTAAVQQGTVTVDAAVVEAVGRLTVAV